ncbi:hypothetical protein EI94DRAFT_1775290 [Lactarius quietus]|nr:hypothetical protein EI94DRAFT_1775290 [Lactarius quietus]
MHIISINLPDLLLGLWHGTIDCDKKDSKDLWDWVVLIGDTWKDHGLDVARCRPYLPGSFDRAPQNPTDKISSGFRAWELLIYIFGYCLALLHNILPHHYWLNFCKLVSAVHILQQCAITAPQVRSAHLLMLSFIEEYEALYYRQMTTRLHFCQQSIHGLSHLAPDTVCLRPGGYSSQWTQERTIGNLGEEIKQPSKPYANLANCSLRRSQLSALHAVMPDLAPNTPALPRGAIELGDGYVLLRAQDETGTVLEGESAGAIRTFMLSESEHRELPVDWQPRYIRWARLRLPNMQIAHCAWKETVRMCSAGCVRQSRNVKHAYVLISVWSDPDMDMLRDSYNTVYSCAYRGQEDQQVIDVKAITSVVAMIPMTPHDGDRSTRFFLLDKPGLDIHILGDTTNFSSE